MKDHRHISVRVPASTYIKFKALARERDLTVSQQIRHFINVTIEAHEATERKTPA